MDELTELLRGQNFASPDEANAFLSRQMQSRNEAPVESFQGLSPEQMHRFLSFKTPQLTTFPPRLDTVPQAPIATLFKLLAEGIGDQGLKATAIGNLPRQFCRDTALAFMGEEKYRQFTKFGDIRSESNFFDLHVTRVIAELAGLVRTYKGKFILSKQCRSLMAEQGLPGIYPRLFQIRKIGTQVSFASENCRGCFICEEAAPLDAELADQGVQDEDVVRKTLEMKIEEDAEKHPQAGA